ncbi:hypothetical protein, partial [Bifidobacterium adolescentis]|uniref:hypothetical protein n=1 Tax=Bifidobacterium adolescentis TaxID=1680 RepID=UPI001E48FFFA
QPAGSELIIVPWTGTTLSAQTFGHYLCFSEQNKGCDKCRADAIIFLNFWFLYTLFIEKESKNFKIY